jgi:hypothetical protein
MLFHRSHVLAGVMLLGLVGPFVLMFARDRVGHVASSLLLLGAAVAIGGLGFVVLDAAVSKMTGRVATPPPFLLARVIEDGPGTSYLRQTCAEEHYVVCRFLWSATSRSRGSRSGACSSAAASRRACARCSREAASPKHSPTRGA